MSKIPSVGTALVVRTWLKVELMALAGLVLLVLLAGCQQTASEAQTAEAVEPNQVLRNYVQIAQASFGDALTTAQTLDGAITTLLDEPSEANLNAAREAWRAARVPYMQTEAYRFGNPVVDAWEGRVNA